jgi:hypothetical protein
MALLDFLLYLAAFIVFVIAFIRARPGWDLIALGLALWVLVNVIHSWPG